MTITTQSFALPPNKPAKPSRRNAAYNAIDSERDYQDKLEPDRTDGHVHSVGEELVLIMTYAHKAMSAWAVMAGDDACLQEIRKIAAICVRTMEHHGAPIRQYPAGDKEAGQE